MRESQAPSKVFRESERVRLRWIFVVTVERTSLEWRLAAVGLHNLRYPAIGCADHIEAVLDAIDLKAVSVHGRPPKSVLDTNLDTTTGKRGDHVHLSTLQ